MDGMLISFPGLEPAGGWTTQACSAWPVRCQTYVTFPAASCPLIFTTLYYLVTEHKGVTTCLELLLSCTPTGCQICHVHLTNWAIMPSINHRQHNP